MMVAAGKVVYSEGAAPCLGIGLTWSDDDLDGAMNGENSGVEFKRDDACPVH